MNSVPAFNQPHARPNLNPLDSDLASDSSANALWAKVRASFTTLVNAFDQVSAICDALFRETTAIEGNTRLTTAANAQDTTNARNSAGQALEALRAQCEAARAQVLDVTTPLLDGTQFTPVRDASGATNYQASLLAIELTRDAWARVRMLLDAVDSPSEKQMCLLATAMQASQRNDKYTVAAIRQNGETYLQAHGVSMPHDLYAANIAEATAASSSPQQRAAMQIEKTVAEGWRNLQSAFLVASGYAKGTSAMRVQGLAGWPGFPTINL